MHVAPLTETCFMPFKAFPLQAGMSRGNWGEGELRCRETHDKMILWQLNAQGTDFPYQVISFREPILPPINDST